MKVITVPDKFLKADGQPFRDIKRDEKGIAVFLRDGQDKILTDSQGNPYLDTQVIELPELLRNFVNSVFALAQQKKKELKIEDSMRAIDVIRATNVIVDHKLELENATYEWLSKRIEEYGVDIVGANAGILAELLKNAEDKGQTRAEIRRKP